MNRSMLASMQEPFPMRSASERCTWVCEVTHGQNQMSHSKHKCGRKALACVLDSQLKREDYSIFQGIQKHCPAIHGVLDIKVCGDQLIRILSMTIPETSELGMQIQ